jgi:putative DNA primase/helicase
MLAMRVLNLGFADAAKRIEAVLGDVGEAEREIPRKEVSRDAMRRLWNGASRIEGTPGELYFKSRGLQAPGCLRYSPQVWYAKDASAPAILAKVASPEGQCVNLYRIFITRDGEKAAMDSPKKMMRASVPPGAAVRLYPRGSTLGIAEGIENAIAASAMFEMPVWATLGTAFMERFVVPEGVEDLVVFADNDKNMSGQKAAYVLAHHVAMNGISVKVEIPSCVGQDWNDVLLEKV